MIEERGKVRESSAHEMPKLQSLEYEKLMHLSLEAAEAYPAG